MNPNINFRFRHIALVLSIAGLTGVMVISGVWKQVEGVAYPVG